MKLPNWFRIGWWALLLVVVTNVFLRRYPSLVIGSAAPSDIVVFFVWLALALAPVFQEVDFFGLKLSQQLKAVKEEVGALRTEIRAAVDIRNQFSPNLTFFPAVPMNELADLAEQVKERAKKGTGVTESDARLTEDATRAVPYEVDFLFQARFALERELRRIYGSRVATSEEILHVPAPRIIRSLLQSELIDRDAAVAAEELYRIASRAIHGGDIPIVQFKFAHDVAGWLLAELRAIE